MRGTGILAISETRHDGVRAAKSRLSAAKSNKICHNLTIVFYAIFIPPERAPATWTIKQKTRKILKDLVTSFMIIEQCHQSLELLGSHKATLDGMLISRERDIRGAETRR
ncbi:hypothetical protein J6590_042104 [Homalodisca vitripennis]|nr:hypothetical protein J6590_042104 [Homalodisca vitripennis]